jgi:hypothetical protein
MYLYYGGSKIFYFFMLAPALLLGDFAEDLANDPREKYEQYYKKTGAEIETNHKTLDKLLKKNQKCVEGTKHIIENATCYAVYLSITESKNLELNHKLAEKCPEWQKYKIEDCK